MDFADISVYPSDLAELLQQRWVDAGNSPQELPTLEQTRRLLDTVYQASLLREEGENVRCRVLVGSPDDTVLSNVPLPSGLHILKFDAPCLFTPHEVRKLAGAAGYYRTLLGVSFDSPDHPQAKIWGMVVSGTSWVNRTDGGRYGGPILPGRLVLQIAGPGHLIAAAGLNRVLESVGGKVLTEGFDPFKSQWLPTHFAPIRQTLIGLLEERLQRPLQTKLCESFVKDVAQSMVRRILSLVRSRGHGGMLIYVSDEASPQLKRWLRFRVRFEQDDSTFRFRELMLQLMQRVLEVGESQDRCEVTWHDYQKMHDIVISELDAALIEFSHFLADLMAVDGALVLNREFRIIGFGGEILGDSHVSCIERALDLEASQSVTEPADSSGTRHRSAYRLVSGLPGTIAVVVSQDGAVRFVARRREKLTYWPYLP